MIDVFKHPYPAIPLTGFVVPHEGRLDGLELQLTQPTVFRGTARTGDGSSLEYELINIWQDGDQQQLTIDGEVHQLIPTTVHLAEVDSEGRFEIILGPGRYSAWLSSFEGFNFEITDQAEIVHQFRWHPYEE